MPPKGAHKFVIWPNIAPRLHILQSGKVEFATYRDCIFEGKRGHSIFLSWMEPRALNRAHFGRGREADGRRRDRSNTWTKLLYKRSRKARVLVTIPCATWWHLLRVFPSETVH